MHLELLKIRAVLQNVRLHFATCITFKVLHPSLYRCIYVFYIRRDSNTYTGEGQCVRFSRCTRGGGGGS